MKSRILSYSALALVLFLCLPAVGCAVKWVRDADLQAMPAEERPEVLLNRETGEPVTRVNAQTGEKLVAVKASEDEAIDLWMTLGVTALSGLGLGVPAVLVKKLLTAKKIATALSDALATADTQVGIMADTIAEQPNKAQIATAVQKRSIAAQVETGTNGLKTKIVARGTLVKT